VNRPRRIAILLLTLGSLLASCGGGSSGGSSSGSGTSSSDPPTSPPVSAPPGTEPPVNNPPTSNPTVKNPTIRNPLASYRVVPLILADGSPMNLPNIAPVPSENFLNGSGEVLGEANSKAWIYRNGTTHELGWTDFEGAPAEAFQTSAMVSINERGQVLGYTRISWAEDIPDCRGFDCINVFTHSRSWIYHEGSYVDVGRVGPGLSADMVNAEAFDLNEAGEATGSTYWNNDNEEGPIGGNYAWLYANGVSHDISLVEETPIGGSPLQINEAGDVIGVAFRSGFLGMSCWMYTQGTTYPIGMLDSAHIDGSSGRRFCDVRQLNESAQVIGGAQRYSLGINDFGTTAWMYSEGDTMNVGLLDDEHTDDDGRRQSWAHLLNDAGQVAGRATRYGSGGGETVWIFDNGVTQAIGLTDLEHTRGDGARTSGLPNRKTAMNGFGQVIGYSVRYNSVGENTNKELGRTVWLYSGGTHTRLGLNEADYTAADGSRYSEAITINQAGQVAGYSNLYQPGVNSPDCFPSFSTIVCDPRTAWFYDQTTQEIFPLGLSSRSDGYAYSDVFHLSESGIASGYYMAFKDDDSFEWRMFQFSHELGLHDVIIDGMEAGEGTAPPTLTHDSGHFVGSLGLLAGNSELTPFLLSPLSESESPGE
jgi:hypothetical protein